MDNIKNIIFDLGGVVIDIERNRAVRALEALGVVDASTLLGEYQQSGPFLKLETGEMTAAGFFDTILAKCAPGTTTTKVADAFEQFLVDLPVSRLEAIGSLRERGYRLYVLSNTNPVMYNDWITDHFRGEGKTVNDYFDGIVVSFQELMCKPDPRLFATLVKRYGLNPEQTLMLDDSEANCEAARSIGLKAIRITKEGDHSFRAVTDMLIEKGATR